MNYFINYYGEGHQKKKLIEECIELIIALFNTIKQNKLKTLVYIVKTIWKKRSSNNVQEEMGDVYNLITQFQEYWNDGSIYNWCMVKQERQLARMQKEQEGCKI